MGQRECGSHVIASGTNCPVCFHAICESKSPDGRLRCTRTAGHDGIHENGWTNPPASWLGGVMSFTKVGASDAK
jgi:hypothetical protein